MVITTLLGKYLFKIEAVLFQDLSSILPSICAYAIKIMIHIPKKSRIARGSPSQNAGLLIVGCTLLGRE
jgi:hypothetical protein